MPSIEPIHPLKDVWLRPRRVFRELAARPAGIVDYLLAAAQGILNFLAIYRTEEAGAHRSVEQILGESFLFGSVAGVISLYLLAAIYRRLGARAGGTSTRHQVIHVLAYGGVPLVASLALWVLTALLAGEATFMKAPHGEVEGFVVFLLQAQFIAYVFLLMWSVVLQVMGLSEILGLSTRKAFAVWVLGQLLGLLAGLMLAVVVAVLFPATASH